MKFLKFVKNSYKFVYDITITEK